MQRCPADRLLTSLSCVAGGEGYLRREGRWLMVEKDEGGGGPER